MLQLLDTNSYPPICSVCIPLYIYISRFLSIFLSFFLSFYRYIYYYHYGYVSAHSILLSLWLLRLLSISRTLKDPQDVALNLIHSVHKTGINFRYLGLVRKHCVDPYIRDLILGEMISRVVKNDLRQVIPPLYNLYLYLLSIIYYLLSITYYLLSIIYYLLSIIYYLLSIIYYLLSIISSLLFLSYNHVG